MAGLIWAEPALYDLNDIAEYIALDNLDAAKRLIKTIFRAVETLEEFPESGRRPPELKGTQYREKIVGPCRIFYRQEKKKIYILYVMRVERELRKHLLEERKKIKS
jgi:toxin ParE1/3/4